MKTIKLTIMIAFLGALFTNVSSSQSCTSLMGIPQTLAASYAGWLVEQGCTVADVAADATSSNGTNTRRECEEFINNARHLKSVQKQKWLQKINSPQWAMIGPRHIAYNRKQSGNIVSRTNRTFIMRVPSTKNRLRVTCTEKNGRGKTSFSVCTMDGFQSAQNRGVRWFNDTSSKKNNRRESQTIDVVNAYGKIIMIRLEGQSAGQSFKYDVKIR